MAKTKVVFNGHTFNKTLAPIEFLYDGPKDDVLQWIFAAFPERDVTESPAIYLGYDENTPNGGWALTVDVEEIEE